MAIDAIILDLGNVLAFHDNEKLFNEMARAFDTTRDAIKAQVEPGFWERVNTGHVKGDLLRQELVQRLGKDLSPAKWLEVWNCHFTVNEPMVAMTQFLVGQAKLVLLSNTHDQHVTYLKPLLPVLQSFDALIFSCEVGVMKPDKRIFEQALAAAGTLPWKTVFFDDVKAYASAATQVGMHGRVFTTVEQFSDDLAKLGFKAG
ncbi:MAG: HAD family phosphatase [Myxococcaceae bacterium]